MAIVGLEGVIAIETSVRGTTTNSVAYGTFPKVAVIVVLPAETAITIPSGDIVATAGEDELQLGDEPGIGVDEPSV